MAAAGASDREMLHAAVDRVAAVLLVLAVSLGAMVLLATPATACSCEEQIPVREEVLARGGAVEGRVQTISEPYEDSTGTYLVDIEIAVRRAFGADPGPSLVRPAINGPVDLGDGTTVETSCDIGLLPGREVAFFLDEEVLSLCSILRDGVDTALAEPPPAVTRDPVRLLGLPHDPGSSVAGLTAAGAYVTQVALPSIGPLVRCPGDASAVVQHGGGIYTGVEDITWSRLDLTTLAVEELIDIQLLNPDPTQLQNVSAGTICLTPDASDVLALFSWWESPDIKPQRLVRVTDGVVTELVIAPIWQIWHHDGTVYGRVGEAGTDIVTVDPATGAFTPHGTLPTPGVLSPSTDGSWGLLADRSDSTGARTVHRVQLVPDVVVTATTTVTDRQVHPMTDGRTLLVLPIQDSGPVLDVLDEALAPEGAASLPGDRWDVVVLADDPAGAWLRDGDGRLTRWDRGAEPVGVGYADLVLPVEVVPSTPFPTTEITLVTYDLSDVPAAAATLPAEIPPGRATPTPTPEATSSATAASDDGAWPALGSVLLSLLMCGALLGLASRTGTRGR